METVISTSTYNASSKVSNAEWESILSETLILNDGDVISIKNSYLDTRIRNSDDIYIEEDTPLMLEHYYYWNYVTTDNKSAEAPSGNDNSEVLHVLAASPIETRLTETTPTLNTFNLISVTGRLWSPDGLPYLLMIFYYPYNYETHSYPTSAEAQQYNIAKQWTPHVGKWEYVLKKGTYAKDYLATLLTKQMAMVRPNLYDERFEPNIGGADDNFARSATGSAGGLAMRPAFVINPVLINTVSTISMFVNFGISDPPFEDYSEQSFIPGSNVNLVPAFYMSICNALNNGGRVNPKFMGSQENKFDTYGICPYYTMDGDLNNIFEQVPFLSPMAGATEISLLWSDQNNGIYSFDYIHSPIIIKDKEVVVASSSCYGTPHNSGDPTQYTPQSIAMSDRQSGIIFANMSPSIFWKDTLGFDVPNIIYRFQNVIGTNPSVPSINWNDYLSRTTSNYWGSAMIQAVQAVSTVSSVPYQFPVSFRDVLYRKWGALGYSGMLSWESDSTNTLDAITAPVNINDTGHFLIEITGYNNNYFDEKDAYQIKAIVSSYYITANSFATAPFPDSFVYQHHGEPLIIGSLKIRILNPKTKRTEDLGANSTVYLQVTQNITPAKVQQPES